MWQNCRSTIWALWGKLGQQWGWVWQGRFPHQQQLSIHKSPSFSGDTYFPFFSRSRQMCRLCAYAKQYSRVHAVWKTAFTLKPYCSLPELQAGFPSWWAALLQACVGLWANLDNSRAITRTVISDPDPAWILSIVPLSLVLYTQSAAAWQALKSQFSHPNRPTSGSHCCTNGSIGEENPDYLSVWRPEVEISGRTELLHEHYWFHYYFLIHICWKLIQPGHWWPFLVGWLVGLVLFFVVLFCFICFLPQACIAGSLSVWCAPEPSCPSKQSYLPVSWSTACSGSRGCPCPRPGLWFSPCSRRSSHPISTPWGGSSGWQYSPLLYEYWAHHSAGFQSTSSTWCSL